MCIRDSKVAVLTSGACSLKFAMLDACWLNEASLLRGTTRVCALQRIQARSRARKRSNHTKNCAGVMSIITNATTAPTSVPKPKSSPALTMLPMAASKAKKSS